MAIESHSHGQQTISLVITPIISDKHPVPFIWDPLCNSTPLRQYGLQELLFHHLILIVNVILISLYNYLCH